MELNVLSKKSDCDCNETTEETETRLIPNKPMAIKAAWKSSKIFEPYSVTYVSPQPIDKFNFICIVLFFQGIGVFLPWNMFINAETYFRDFKLNVINASEVNLDNEKHFLFYFGFTANPSSVIAMGFNLLLPISPVWSLTRRITLSITIQVIIVTLTIFLAILDTSQCPKLFFYVTLSSIIILNIANGIYQNCIYGIAGFLPNNYSRILVFGLYTGGFILSLLHIILIMLTESLRLSSIYYFVASFIVLLVCFDTYFTSSMSRFYRYHKERSKFYTSSEDYEIQESYPSLYEIFEKCWKQYLNIYLVFLVSYSIFPLIQIDIKPHSNLLYFLPNKCFIPITCHLLFNSSSTLGCLISIFVNSEKPLPQKLWILITMRLLFIPFYMFCNFKPESRKWPVIVNNDFIYLFANFSLGFSNGLFGSLSIMSAPKCVQQKYSFLAGMLSALFIMSGVMTAFLLSFLLSNVIEYEVF